MKSLLFVINGMGTGGIERCLISFLNIINYSEYSVDLLILQRDYELISMVNPNVHILDQYAYVMTTQRTLSELRNRHASADRFIKYFAYRIVNKLRGKSWKFFQTIEKCYDVAIAYGINGNGMYYVIDKVKAKKKIVWHHNGTYEKTGKRKEIDREYLKKYDHIVCVSEQCKNRLENAFPELSSEMKVVYSPLDIRRIDKLKTAFNPEFSKSCMNIVTVGRLSEEKGPWIMIEVANQLKKRGIAFRWFWCGDGIEKKRLEEYLINNDLSSEIRLLGNCPNPYPYMNMCDIYVQPSVYEAYCTSTNEARYLCKPIVVTDVGGMREQFSDGYTAIICPQKCLHISEAICNLINDTHKRAFLINNLKKEKDDINIKSEEYKELL